MSYGFQAWKPFMVSIQPFEIKHFKEQHKFYHALSPPVRLESCNPNAFVATMIIAEYGYRSRLRVSVPWCSILSRDVHENSVMTASSVHESHIDRIVAESVQCFEHIKFVAEKDFFEILSWCTWGSAYRVIYCRKPDVRWTGFVEIFNLSSTFLWTVWSPTVFFRGGQGIPKIMNSW